MNAEGMSGDPFGWMDDAACAIAVREGRAKLDDWFPNRGHTTKRALAICAACPVLIECRDHGRAYREPGVWGGESASAREAVTGMRTREFSRPDPEQVTTIRPEHKFPGLDPSISRYNAGCRCEECFALYQDHRVRMREARRERLHAERDASRPAHEAPCEPGLTGYNHYGCRCAECARAARWNRSLRRQQTA